MESQTVKNRRVWVVGWRQNSEIKSIPVDRKRAIAEFCAVVSRKRGRFRLRTDRMFDAVTRRWYCQLSAIPQ